MTNKRFTYKNQVFEADGLVPVTRWRARCITCGEPYTFTSPGDCEPPRWPTRRCKSCRPSGGEVARLRAENERLRKSLLAAIAPED